MPAFKRILSTLKRRSPAFIGTSVLTAATACLSLSASQRTETEKGALLPVRICRGNSCKAFESPHGEVIAEMFGDAVGGTNAHSLARCTIPFAKSSLVHFHPEVEECYYILSGTGEMHYCPVYDAHLQLTEQEIATQREQLIKHWNDHKRIVKVSKGDAIAIPKHNWHQIHNTNPQEDLQFIVTCVPSWTPQCAVNLLA